MRKFKQWLINHILPIWARQELQAENEKLHALVAKQQTQLREQAAYIEGLETGIRALRKIVINNGEVSK